MPGLSAGRVPSSCPLEVTVPGVHLLSLAGPPSNPTAAPSPGGGSEKCEVDRFARITRDRGKVSPGRGSDGAQDTQQSR